MLLWLIIAFYLILAACEIVSPLKCLHYFEKLISPNRIRSLGIFFLLIALLYYTSEPKRLQWLVVILLWIYLLSGIWILIHPQSFVSLCKKSYTTISLSEKRLVLKFDCAVRTALALLLIYAII